MTDGTKDPDKQVKTPEQESSEAPEAETTHEASQEPAPANPGSGAPSRAGQQRGTFARSSSYGWVLWLVVAALVAYGIYLIYGKRANEPKPSPPAVEGQAEPGEGPAMKENSEPGEEPAMKEQSEPEGEPGASPDQTQPGNGAHEK